MGVILCVVVCRQKREVKKTISLLNLSHYPSRMSMGDWREFTVSIRDWSSLGMFCSKVLWEGLNVVFHDRRVLCHHVFPSRPFRSPSTKIVFTFFPSCLNPPFSDLETLKTPLKTIFFHPPPRFPKSTGGSFDSSRYRSNF